MIQFCNNNKEFLEKEVLNKDDLLFNFRVLRFSELASTKDELHYEEVSKALSVELDDVEYWVIQAISKNIVSCNLDQLENKIHIRKALPRIYGEKNWIDLNNKIESWKNNLTNLKQHIISKTKEEIS